jgi:hypothetical protein
MCLLSSLKCDIVHTVLSFLGIINVGDAHPNDDCHSYTPMLHSCLISFMRMALFVCGIGYGLPWYGFIPSFNSMDTGGRFQSPNVPLISDSNLSRIESSFSLSEAPRREQSPLKLLEDPLFHTWNPIFPPSAW